MNEILNIFSLKKGNNNRNDFLKIIGILTMAIDHIGIVFFPQFLIFRAIGRLALPIFAFGIADGYRYTSNLKNYLSRILIVGLVSQIPYVLLFNTLELNILFLFFVSLLVLYAVDKKIYFGIIPLLVILFFFPIDYGWYGVAMILLFYIFKEKRIWLISSLALIIAISTWQIGSFVIVLQMLGVWLAVYLPKNFCKINISNNLFYWFYPAHLIVLLIIRLILI